MNHKRIVLVGHAASGKDYMRKLFEKRGFTYGISYTSRPPREGEVNGVDYYFLSKEEFEQKIEENFFYEYVPFNNWYYGTANWQMNECDLFIMTPKDVSYLKESDRNNSFIIYVDIPIEIRRKRLLERNDNNDSIERRINADEEDFKDFNNYDIQITNSKF